MKKTVCLLVLCYISIAGKAQYYYNDIVAAKISQQQYLVLKNNKIRIVTATSRESNNQATENFKLEQQISPDAKTIKLYTSYPAAGTSVTTNYYDNDRMVKTIDSNTNVITTTSFQYDNSGNINSILIETNDAVMDSHSKELHEWKYEQGKPVLMLKIKDNTDTTRIEFNLDEQGNIAQENWKRKGRVIERYYYYYNDKNQLTDIVRYNSRAKKLLPDFLFEFDANGRMTQMTQVPTGSNNYLVWKYVYNEKGLKQREVLLNKQNELVGTIEYQYQ